MYVYESVCVCVCKLRNLLVNAVNSISEQTNLFKRQSSVCVCVCMRACVCARAIVYVSEYVFFVLFCSQ